MSRFAGPLQQVGLVVADVRTAIAHWTQCLGVGPFVVMPELLFENYRYYGQKVAGPTVTLAFAQSGCLQIELIQQHDQRPSAYRDFLDAGREGVQHLCAWPESPIDYEVRRATLVERGLTIVHEGNARGSDLRFCYFTTSGSLATPLLELSEGNLPAMRPLWQRLRARADAWDGLRPVLSVEELMS